MQQQSQHEQQLDLNEMQIREHLLAAQAAGEAQAQTPHLDQLQPQITMGHHPHQIDSSIASSQYMMEADLGSDLEDGKRGGKNRELSNSKRAAQNRAAQRAFRQRKEGYIKKLEEQVRGFIGLEDSFKHLQSENFDLRNYILQLQSQLLESQGSYPPPPPSISNDMRRGASVSLPQQTHIHHQQQQQHQELVMERHQVGSAPASMSGQEEQLEQQPPLYDAHNDAQMSPAAVDQLQAAAAAAQAGEYAPDEDMKHHGLPTDEDTYAVEEAARAAAYAVTKSLEEEQRMDDQVDASTTDNVALPE